MGSLARCQILWLVFAGLFPTLAVWQQSRQTGSSPHSLFSQSAAEILQRKYGQTETSYLLLDAASGELLASHWTNPDEPIPMGSLVKPFTALAYAETHDFHYPIYVCRGKATGCWQDQPHGELALPTAISVSCNSYFRRLAESVPLEHLVAIANSFGLEAPNASATSANLIGLGNQWGISPLHMARAYLELVRRKDAPGVAPILEGMRESGLHGTGAAVDRQLKHSAALVKTGTAACTHLHWAPADGFVLALVPTDKPQILLLIRMHSVAGAKAAETAGHMLHDMEE